MDSKLDVDAFNKRMAEEHLSNPRDRTNVSEKLTAENKRLRAALTKIAQFSQTEQLLWWQMTAREALDKDTGE
jgi:hypothetical protein|tara:strand:- start:476 stop:694 length:219 start_codon:yes stop_codon:yes gene_type:complete